MNRSDEPNNEFDNKDIELNEEYIKKVVKSINSSDDSDLMDVFLTNHFWPIS